MSTVSASTLGSFTILILGFCIPRSTIRYGDCADSIPCTVGNAATRAGLGTPPTSAHTYNAAPCRSLPNPDCPVSPFATFFTWDPISCPGISCNCVTGPFCCLLTTPSANTARYYYPSFLWFRWGKGRALIEAVFNRSPLTHYSPPCSVYLCDTPNQLRAPTGNMNGRPNTSRGVGVLQGNPGCRFIG